MEQIKVLLEDHEIPRQWYNIHGGFADTHEAAPSSGNGKARGAG